MLKKILIILRIIISVCLLSVVFVFSYNYLNKAFISQIPKEAASGFKAIKDDKLDVVVVGSSHAQYSFNPAFFFEESGLYSYVMASQCQPLPVSYQIVKEILKTQHPKLLVLEVFTATPLKEMCSADSCYVAAQSLLTGDEKREVISYLPEDKAKEYEEKTEETYNDLLTNHNMWKELNDFSFLLPNYESDDIVRNIDASFGYVYQDGFDGTPRNHWHIKIHSNIPEAELEPEDLEALNNIYELCKKEDIELLLYKTPMDSIDPLNQAYRYKVWQWAEEKNIKYVDFVNMTKQLDYYMFVHSDSFHANITGAGIMTDYLAKFIKENYVFNHQKDEDLDLAYTNSYQDYITSYLFYERLSKTYLRILADGYDGDILIRYKKSNYTLNDDIINYLRQMGFEDFDGINNYYGHARNNTLIDYDNLELNTRINNHNIRIDDNGVYFNDELWSQDAYLQIVYISNNGDVVIKNIDLNTMFEKDYINYDDD